MLHKPFNKLPKNMKTKYTKFIFIIIAIGFILIFSSNTGQTNILNNIKSLFKDTISTETATSTIEKTDNIETYKPVIDYENAITGAVEYATPSVVSIVITKDLPIVQDYRNDFYLQLPPEFRDFFGYPEQSPNTEEQETKKQEIGGGTGFIVSADGLIITNKHVVIDEDAEYTVLTNDGHKYDAEIVTKDPVQDIAILQIEADNVTPAKLGNSDTIKLGQTAIAIGNALGEFRNTVSVGVVSGLSRSIIASGMDFVEKLENVIQTDAAINKGNSGGPLINLKGEVIGMNTAIAQGAQNIGFAIPINRIKRDIESVKTTGTIRIPFLGVRYRMITPEFAENQDLFVEEGALVRGNEKGPAIFPNSSADKAGLQAEDIIIKINGEKINRENTLGHFIQSSNIGERITLTVIRDGEEIKLHSTLEERPEL